MLKFKQQIGFKVVTLILAMTLLVPSAVKFSHIWTHLHHEICNGEPETHLHKADLDCNFYKFKLSAPFTVPTIEFEFHKSENNHPLAFSDYWFLNDYQQLHFSLRGPPRINLM